MVRDKNEKIDNNKVNNGSFMDLYDKSIKLSIERTNSLE